MHSRFLPLAKHEPGALSIRRTQRSVHNTSRLSFSVGHVCEFMFSRVGNRMLSRNNPCSAFARLAFHPWHLESKPQQAASVDSTASSSGTPHQSASIVIGCDPMSVWLGIPLDVFQNVRPSPCASGVRRFGQYISEEPRTSAL